METTTDTGADTLNRILAELEEERVRQGLTYHYIANKLNKAAQGGITRLLTGVYPATSLAEVAKVAEVLGKKIVLANKGKE